MKPQALERTHQTKCINTYCPKIFKGTDFDQSKLPSGLRAVVEKTAIIARVSTGFHPWRYGEHPVQWRLSDSQLRLKLKDVVVEVWSDYSMCRFLVPHESCWPLKSIDIDTPWLTCRRHVTVNLRVTSSQPALMTSAWCFLSIARMVPHVDPLPDGPNSFWACWSRLSPADVKQILTLTSDCYNTWLLLFHLSMRKRMVLNCFEGSSLSSRAK